MTIAPDENPSTPTPDIDLDYIETVRIKIKPALLGEFEKTIDKMQTLLSTVISLMDEKERKLKKAGITGLFQHEGATIRRLLVLSGLGDYEAKGLVDEIVSSFAVAGALQSRRSERE